MSSGTFAQDLRAAQSEALACLLRLMRDSLSETQVRLAAAAILRFSPPRDPLPDPAPVPPVRAEPSPTAPVPAASPAPLSPGELAALARFLPHVAPSRFTSRHTPDHWRDVLRTQARLHSSAAATSTHAPKVEPPGHSRRSDDPSFVPHAPPSFGLGASSGTPNVVRSPPPPTPPPTPPVPPRPRAAAAAPC